MIQISTQATIEEELCGHKLVYKAWGYRREMEFFSEFDKCESVIDFKKLAFKTVHEGLVSVDGEPIEAGSFPLENIESRHLWDLTKRLANACGLSSEDKKKSES